MLDPQWGINAYVTCANGAMKTEMVNSVNGLDSVVVSFAAKDAAHVKGTLKTGDGNCPGPGGRNAYCNATGDYTFDAVYAK
jgi:hypothetical protein